MLDYVVWAWGALCVLAGLVSWTFFEYIVHRWLFHGRFMEQLHSFHHYMPWRRYVIPARLVLPLTAMFAGTAWWLSSTYLYAGCWAAGVIVGWRYYELVHGSFHGDHNTIYQRLPRFLYTMYHRHQLHHGSDPSKNFGVTTSLWDRVFRSNLKAQVG